MKDNVRVELVRKKNGDYKLYLIGANSPVVMFSGGHDTVDEGLLMMSKMYKRFDKVSKNFLIEEGDYVDFEFNVWYWIDIIKKDKIEKYYFTLENPILENRKEDMIVQNKEYIIKKIFQSKQKKFPIENSLIKKSLIKKMFSDKETLTVQFWLDKDYEFNMTDDKLTFPRKPNKKVMNAIIDIANQIDIDDWVAKLHKSPSRD